MSATRASHLDCLHDQPAERPRALLRPARPICLAPCRPGPPAPAAHPDTCSPGTPAQPRPRRTARAPTGLHSAWSMQCSVCWGLRGCVRCARVSMSVGGGAGGVRGKGGRGGGYQRGQRLLPGVCRASALSMRIARFRHAHCSTRFQQACHMNVRVLSRAGCCYSPGAPLSRAAHQEQCSCMHFRKVAHDLGYSAWQVPAH